MAYNIKNTGNKPIPVKHYQIGDTKNRLDLQEVEFIDGSGVNLSQIGDFQTVTAANDLLQNGILVETSKGYDIYF